MRDEKKGSNKMTRDIFYQQTRHHILTNLEELFNAENEGTTISLRDQGSKVIIDYNNGSAKIASVAMDTLEEMAYDILKAKLHGGYVPYTFHPKEEGEES